MLTIFTLMLGLWFLTQALITCDIEYRTTMDPIEITVEY